MLCRTGTVLIEHLPSDILGPPASEDDLPTMTSRSPPVESERPPPVSASRPSIAPPALPSSLSPLAPSVRAPSLKEETDRIEYDRIVEALRLFHGNQSRAAEHLGMTRRALIVRLDRFRIPRPRKADLP